MRFLHSARSATRAVRIGSGVAVLGLAAGIFGAAPASAAAPEPVASIGIDGAVVTQVLLDGELMSMADYTKVRAQADAAGGGIAMVVDRSAVARGYVVAYRDRAAASAYMQAHGMGTLPSSDRDPVAEAATAARHATEAASFKASASTPAIATLGCGLPNHLAYLYADLSCGGASLAIGWNEADPDLRVYGWNDRASSIAIGDCISNMTVWANINYSGSQTSYGGGDVYTSLPGWNDTISSLKTDVSGVCA